MKKLTKEQILLLQQDLIEQTGGTAGLRDKGLLESALFTPFQSFDGNDMFPSLQQKAARLGFGLVQNHPFVDGNKRIGAHAMLVFLSLNGVELAYTQQELSGMILDVAAGKQSFEDMVVWIQQHQG